MQPADRPFTLACTFTQPPLPPLNYRHIFHAGVFCDVFKHSLLLALIRRMQRKEKGFLFLDAHAGLGAYDLSSSPAQRTREYTQGILRIWEKRSRVPTRALDSFLDIVRRFNRQRGGTDAVLRFYPGSPRIASMVLRPQDRLALAELHPEDHRSLQKEFSREKRVSIQRIDAYSALRAYLPPPEKRALVLIDPPYEDRNEVARIREGLADALRRFPSGVYSIWYPIKDPTEVEAFKGILGTIPLPPTLAIELKIYASEPPDRLNGCGLLVLNPPWRIAEELEPLLSALRGELAAEPGSKSRLDWLRAET